MQYFVTGATGFIGRRLVRTLLARRGSVVYYLLRPESAAKVPDLLAYWGVGKNRAIPVYGDLTSKRLGVDNDDLPEHSSYRSVTPMAATIYVEAGSARVVPWVIDYKHYNDPIRNRFFATAPEIAHKAE